MEERANRSSNILYIELLPEFGWSIHGQPTYGPGAVFQGSVRVTPDEELKVDHIRLQFHAVESMHSVEIVPGVLRTKKPHTLFGVQKTLWKGQSLEPSSLTLPFTIQMPDVQYPPSVEHEYYRCTFMLTAFLEYSSQIVQSTEKRVYFRPFIETCLLKRPIKTPDGQLKFHSLEYVPGDTISVMMSMNLSSSSVDSTSGNKRTVTAKLYQTARLHGFADIPKLTKVVVSQRWDEDKVDEHTILQQDIEVPLIQIPLDLIPSFSYSGIFSVSYQLKGSVKHKKLGGLWSSGQDFQFPVSIGTLGYGVYSPTQLRIYSTLSTEEQQEQVPRFMRTTECPDMLPAYDSARLPAYDNATEF